MRLWLVSAPDYGAAGREFGAWSPRYDKVFGVVVRADTAQEARELAAGNCGNEGREPWLDEDQAQCVELTADGPAGIILTDFSAG